MENYLHSLELINSWNGLNSSIHILVVFMDSGMMSIFVSMQYDKQTLRVSC